MSGLSTQAIYTELKVFQNPLELLQILLKRVSFRVNIHFNLQTMQFFRGIFHSFIYFILSFSFRLPTRIYIQP